MKHTRAYRMLAGAMVIVLGAIVLITVYWTKDYGDTFRERKGTYAQAVVTPRGDDSLFERSWITVTSSSGLNVTCGMLVPQRKDTSSQRRFPAIILLGGMGTGRYAVDYALDIQDVILVSPNYPYEPKESYTATELIGDIPVIRQAFFDMIPTVMLLTDYLWSRTDVDTTKLVILGYSFGAPFVPVLLAYDRRAALAAIVYGGGDLRSLIRHNVARYRGALAAEVLGSLSGFLLHPLEPLRYAGRISPIPLLMINGAQDEQIPRHNAELLFAAAREPKEIVWLESRHVRPDNVDLTRAIVRELKNGLARRRIIVP